MTSPIYLSFVLPIFVISIIDLLIDNVHILKYTQILKSSALGISAFLPAAIGF